MTSKFVEKAKQMYTTCAHSRFDLSYIFLLLLLESILSSAIIQFVSYTEIDWEAYMQQVDLWQAGEYNYRNLRGGTGPLVYPAGFLYLYGILKRFTNDGTNIHQAQVYFIFLYIMTQAIVLAIYTLVSRQIIKTSLLRCNTTQVMQQAHMTWSWRMAMACCCLSKRIHSIFVLRLFNDGPAMLLLSISVLLFMRNQWRIGCVFFSFAVSIKMNILLFAPGLLLLLLQFPENIMETIVCLGICASIQLLLGAPFLSTYPEAYLRKAFEFDRVFFYKWTVNWKVCYCCMVYCVDAPVCSLFCLHPLLYYALAVLAGGHFRVQATVDCLVGATLVRPCLSRYTVVTFCQRANGSKDILT